MSLAAARARASGMPRPRGASLAGGGTLARLILRRDRVRLPVWIGAIALLTVGLAASLPDLYADAAEWQARAELMANPGVRAFSGPGYGLDDYTFGAMLAQEFLGWTAIFVALMSLLLTVRHTRAEEEAQRAELIRSAPVGRHAPMAAALGVACGASVGVGALIALGIGALGIEDVGWAGSWLFGAALASVGVVFSATALLASQLAQGARAAGGLAGAAFAGAYLVRAAGDMRELGGSALSWLSPIGWAQQTRVYVDDRWWPLLGATALAVAVSAAAFALNARRDMGAGIMRPPPRAAHGLGDAREPGGPRGPASSREPDVVGRGAPGLRAPLRDPRGRDRGLRA